MKSSKVSLTLSLISIAISCVTFYNIHRQNKIIDTYLWQRDHQPLVSYNDYDREIYFYKNGDSYEKIDSILKSGKQINWIDTFWNHHRWFKLTHDDSVSLNIADDPIVFRWEDSNQKLRHGLYDSCYTLLTGISVGKGLPYQYIWRTYPKQFWSVVDSLLWESIEDSKHWDLNTNTLSCCGIDPFSNERDTSYLP